MEHYKIPASKCLIVPIRKLEEDVLCDVHWEDTDGLQAAYNLMFAIENLEPLNTVDHPKLVGLWVSVYKPLDHEQQNLKASGDKADEWIVLTPI